MAPDPIHIQNGIAAATLTALILWLLHPVALKLNFLDVPQGRKDHAQPTPYLGGLAMGLGMLSVGLAATGWSNAFIGFAIGAGILILVGLLDDKYDVKWYWRICMQVLAAIAMINIGGVRIEHLGPAFALGDTTLGSLSVPFTILATVGLINAVNMIDGIDGLAGSLVATTLLLLLGAALYSGNVSVASSTVMLGGAVVAFLAYNMRFPWQPKAKFFMGNAGSAFLGFSIAWLAFRLTQNAAHPVSPVLALWFIPIPVMDTLVLMVRRIRTGRSPFNADRNHIHHLMVESGMAPGRSCLVLCGFTLLSGLAAGQALRLDVPEWILLVAYVGLCLTWYGFTMDRSRTVALIRDNLAGDATNGTRKLPMAPLPDTAPISAVVRVSRDLRREGRDPARAIVSRSAQRATNPGHANHYEPGYAQSRPAEAVRAVEYE